MAMKTQKQLLQEIINSMTYASGAAWQMTHAHQDPRFIPIRDLLENMKNNIMQISMGPSDDVASRLKRAGIVLP